MDSYEIVDSGKPHGGRSNFSHTCNLLSQYLKENGSLGDLSLGFAPTSDKGTPTETMNLLSTIEKSGSRNPNLPPASETAPLTIFYGGQVIVFDDFPAEKAKEIMVLASKSIPVHNHPSTAVTPPLAAQSPAEPATSLPNISQRSFASAQPPLDSDLPIARKNSLARFLEKRRDRITANAPYPAPAKASQPPKKAEAWLGLGPQLPFQIQRN